MPNDFARAATSWPMRPKPRMPSVLSMSSMPLKFLRSQRPSASAPAACGMWRASASSSASVCSAAVTTFERGALTTMIPRLVAAATSTLSTPTPARATARRLVARAISGASTFVAERMTIASYGAMRCSSSSRVQS